MASDIVTYYFFQYRLILEKLVGKTTSTVFYFPLGVRCVTASEIIPFYFFFRLCVGPNKPAKPSHESRSRFCRTNQATKNAPE